MSPAEEDALIKKIVTDESAFPVEDTCAEEIVVTAMRLAIRAAVAQERERCATVCKQVSGRDDTDWYGPAECAAAIRRGEE